MVTPLNFFNELSLFTFVYLKINIKVLNARFRLLSKSLSDNTNVNYSLNVDIQYIEYIKYSNK